MTVRFVFKQNWIKKYIKFDSRRVKILIDRHPPRIVLVPESLLMYNSGFLYN